MKDAIIYVISILLGLLVLWGLCELFHTPVTHNMIQNMILLGIGIDVYTIKQRHSKK